MRVMQDSVVAVCTMNEATGCVGLCRGLAHAQRVMIWHERGFQREHMYRPAVVALAAGLSDPSRLLLVGAGTDTVSAQAAFRGNVSSLRAGDVFIWVGTPFLLQWRSAPAMHRNLWEELEHRRIWRVLYQTEPMPMILQWKLPGGCKPASLGPGLEGSAPTCGLNVGLRSAGRCKAEPPLDEVWDYSAANVEACASPGRRSSGGTFPLDMFPPHPRATMPRAPLAAQKTRGCSFSGTPL